MCLDSVEVYLDIWGNIDGNVEFREYLSLHNLAVIRIKTLCCHRNGESGLMSLVHVEVALEDSLLEVIWLGAVFWLLGLGSLGRGMRHVGDGLGSIVLVCESTSRRGAREAG
jgi:hypothetical protein